MPDGTLGSRPATLQGVPYLPLKSAVQPNVAIFTSSLNRPEGTCRLNDLPPAAEMFASVARGYDRFNSVASLGIDRIWRRAAARAVAAGLSAGRILDVCAGTGELTAVVAEVARPARLVASDLVPEMLSVARAKLARAKVPAAMEFVVADAERLPFSDGEFDAVVVGFGVRNLRSRPRAFAEFLRVLAAGGRCGVLELARPRGPLLRAGHSLYMASVVPLLGGMLTGNRPAYQYLRRSVMAFPPPETIAGELKEAGFAGVQWRRLSLGAATLHLAVK